jgi:hypothetical protein
MDKGGGGKGREEGGGMDRGSEGGCKFVKFVEIDPITDDYKWHKIL